MVVHVQTNTMNSWILPCMCFVMQKHSAYVQTFHIRLARPTMLQSMKWQRLQSLHTGEPCHAEQNSEGYWHYNHLSSAVDTINNRWRQIKNYIWLERCQNTWLRRFIHDHHFSSSSIYIYIYCTLHRCSSCCTVYKCSAVSGSRHNTASTYTVYHILCHL